MNLHQNEWIVRNCNKEAAQRIKQIYKYNDVTCRWIATRIQDDEEKLSHWIEPKLQKLGDPYLLTGAEEAAEKLAHNIHAQSRFLIYSDYDVDGITSASLFYRTLRDLGAKNIECFIPDRIEEGYGLSSSGWARAGKDSTPEFIIILDCGTHSEEVVATIKRESGADGIIIDHHHALKKPDLPEGWMIINPHLPETLQEEYQLFCTAGLSFKVIHSLIKKLEEQNYGAREMVELKDLLDLVAVGTISDLVPLTEENRILTRAGLHCLGRTRNLGLRALLEISSISTDKPIDSSDVAFRIGPRINAGGRVEDPKLPLNLLLTDDIRASYDLAQKLNTINDKRKSIEKKVYLEASARVETELPYGVVLGDKMWHPGVVGIVAGRLARDLHRPTIILGWDGKNYKGSSRSITGIDLMQVMKHCEVKPEKWGGHPMAMGLTLHPKTLESFQKAFARAVEIHCEGKLPHNETRLDTWATPEELDHRCFMEIENLGPYGMGNPLPKIGITKVVLQEAPHVFGKEHIRFPLVGSQGVEVVGWRMHDSDLPLGKPIDLAVRLQRNFWKNREFLQAELQDWRISPGEM